MLPNITLTSTLPPLCFRSKATSYWGGGGPTLQSQSSIGSISSNGDTSTNTARSPCVDARRAYELLLRSLTCLLRDRAHALHLQLPANWPPHAWLVLFTAAVKRDAKGDGKLMAASTLASLDPAAAAAAAAAGAVDGSVALGGATLAGQQGDLMAGIWGEGGWGLAERAGGSKFMCLLLLVTAVYRDAWMGSLWL